jgi:hypothetical protein
MYDAITDMPAEIMLYGALELSKNSWLLALQFPDHAQPSLHLIRGGDTEGLMAKLMAARDRWAKLSGKTPSIVLCYEAGYDAFWLARFSKQAALNVWWLMRPACRSTGAHAEQRRIGSMSACCCGR